MVRYELVAEPCVDQKASYVRPPPIPGPAVPGVGVGGAGEDVEGGGRGMDVDAVMIERRAASWESTSSVGCIGSKGS